MFRRVLIFLLLAAAAAFLVPRWIKRHRSPWSEIARGVEMRRFASINSGGAANITAFRFAPSRLHVLTGKPATAEEWRRRGEGIIAVNGAFFDSSNRSLGLRISDGRLRVRPAGAGAVFQVRRGRATIVSAADFQMRRSITQAVQCTPRLVANGRVAQLKDQWARRTALGIMRDGRVVLAVADGAISLRDWAVLWAARDGLSCPNALSLDGGGSTQLSVRTPRAKLGINGFTSVPDAVVIR